MTDITRTALKPALLAALMALVVALTPLPAQAQGVGGVPSTVNIDDVLRGGTVFRPFSLFHTFEDQDVLFTIEFEGEVAEWVQVVRRQDRDTPITELTIEAGGQVDLELRIEVPDDVANGTYEGRLVAVTEPLGEEDVGISAGIVIPITLGVSGTQNLSAAIVAAQFRNAEVGQPARIDVSVSNDGNVTVQPRLVATIERDGEMIAEVVREDRAVFPGENVPLELTWDTTDERTGVYQVTVTGTFDDLDLGSRTGEVEVFARGVFTRTGTLDALEVTNFPEPGGAARVAATITNTGAVEARAVFVGELTRDGALVGGVESNDRFLRAGESGVIQFIVDTEEAGIYRLTGVANFEGTDTNEMSVEFRVGEPAAESDEASWILPAAIAGGVALVLLAAALLWRRRRKRKVGQTV